jgi:cysteine desulfurase / selenocysteine lyase
VRRSPRAAAGKAAEDRSPTKVTAMPTDTATHPHADVHSLRQRIVGIDHPVPLLDGTRAPYVNLDNAASTPPLQDVLDAVNAFAPYYSSVHRGTGFKSRLSTEAYEHARTVVARFVGADLTTNAVIFGKNTTEALNKLSYRLGIGPGDVVISTQLEHHSNDLPWRARSQVVHVRALPDGRFDEDHFDALLAEHAGRVKVVAVTCASNVTGYLQPVHRLARKAHAAGAWLVADAAQFVAHRPLDVKPDGDPEHLDFVALSGHKMYAPFGTGALIGPKAVFLASEPEYRGGGTVEVVTMDEVHYSAPPEREEAGSPNVVGAVALAAAVETLMGVGMDQIAQHEREVLAHALQRLPEVPGMVIYAESDPERAGRDKVGVVPFNVAGVPHALVAAVLGYEGGIGVRHGCFCAHPYVVRLLGIDADEQLAWKTRALGGDRTAMPGMVRMSLGCYSSKADVDRLIDMLKAIAAHDYHGHYEVERASGEYVPQGYVEPLGDYFPWMGEARHSPRGGGGCGRES